MQLDVRERGFAYAEDAPLDMRMNDGTGITAADVLNTYEEREIARILHQYGEEKFARKIAKAIVASARRSRGPVRPPRRAAVRRDPGARAAYRRTPGEADLPGAAHRGQRRDRRAAPGDAGLARGGRVGGRVVVESYHSLEDRLVKQAFTAATRLDVPPRPAVRPRRHGAAFGGHPRRREGDEPSSPRTPAQPASASARSSAPTPTAPEGAPGHEHSASSRVRVQRIAEEAVERARLRVVPRQRVRAPKVPFVMLVSALLLAGVVGLLLFNTTMQQNSFAAADLQTQADDLRSEEQALQAEIDELPTRSASARRPTASAWSCRSARASSTPRATR
jgi:hypothetical protein